MDVPHLNEFPDPALTELTISPETLDKIQADTRLDGELYRFASQLFKQRYASMRSDA